MYEARARSTDQITNFISKRIQGAVLTRQINNTLNYTLPHSQKPFFKEFFTTLDKNKTGLDIASYGISDTTLEEIFLLLTTRDENGDLNAPIKDLLINNASPSIESDRDSGVAIELNSLDSTIG